MTTKPNIKEILAASGSGDLAAGYKFLFTSEVSEDRNFVVGMEQERNQLVGKLRKREQTTVETRTFGRSNGDAIAGLEGLMGVEGAGSLLV